MAPKTCEQCGVAFQAAKASRRFCSKRCSNMGQPRGQAVKRCPGTFYSRHGDRVRQRLRESYRRDPEFREKVLARLAARTAYPTPQPCESCGHARADRHHPDYKKPLEIQWLCRKCHIRDHAEQLGSWGAGLKNTENP